MFHRSKTTRSVDGDAFKEATIIIKISTQHLQQGNSAEDKFSNEDQLFYKEHEKKLRWNLTWHKERGERPWGEKWFPGYGKKKGGEEGEVLRWNSQNDQFSVPNSTHKKFSSKNSKPLRPRLPYGPQITSQTLSWMQGPPLACAPQLYVVASPAFLMTAEKQSKTNLCYFHINATDFVFQCAWLNGGIAKPQWDCLRWCHSLVVTSLIISAEAWHALTICLVHMDRSLVVSARKIWVSMPSLVPVRVAKHSSVPERGDPRSGPDWTSLHDNLHKSKQKEE